MMVKMNCSEYLISLTLTRQMEVLTCIYIGTSSLSIIGSGSIVIVAILKKKIGNAEIRPIFHLSLADLIASLGLLTGAVVFLKLGFSVQNKACSYLTAFSSSFYMSTFLLIALYGCEVYLKMSVKLVRRTIFSYSEDSLDFPGIYYLYLFSWLYSIDVTNGPSNNILILLILYFQRLFPLAITLCLFLIESQEQGIGSLNDAICSRCLPVFHYRSSNCTISTEDDPDRNTIFKFIFLGVLSFSLLAVVVIYILVRILFRRIQQSGGIMTKHQYKQETAVRRWACLYQGVFIVCWLPSIVLGICSLVVDFKMSTYYPLYIIQALVTPLQGLFNCIIYGWRRHGFKYVLQQKNYQSLEKSLSGEHTRAF